MNCKDCVSNHSCVYNVMLPFLIGDSKKYEMVDIDKCILPEILNLWENGVKTGWCCCGHGHTNKGNSMASIAVYKESCNKMKSLGYDRHPTEDQHFGWDLFVPKTKFKYR